MVDQAQCWEKMREIVSLWGEGRKNAAQDIWKQLPEEFRTATMHFALVCLRDPQNVATCPPVTFTSKYGTFKISKDILDELSSVVAEIANG